MNDEMISLRFDDGAARHDRKPHIVIEAARRPSRSVIENPDNP